MNKSMSTPTHPAHAGEVKLSHRQGSMDLREVKLKQNLSEEVKPPLPKKQDHLYVEISQASQGIATCLST